MTRKPTGLSAFAVKRSEPAAPQPDAGNPASPDPAGTRRRGQGETVALTVRLSRADWARLHALALSEGVSLQILATRGFSRVLAEHGLPAIE